VVVTPDKRLIYTDNIEAARMRGEEHFEELGFEYVEFPWHQPKTPDHLGLLTDDDPGIALALQQLREVLLASEQERYRALGRDAALALEDAVRAIEPGDTEFRIASRLDANCRTAGGLAIVNLVGTDERISRYRHPLVTMKTVEKLAMVVVCMRREGLVVAATRFVHFGETPPELKEKARKVAAIDAAVIAATQPGRTLGEAFVDLVAAYDAHGETDQWRNHHQGGSIGYNSREKIAVPDDPTPIRVGQAFAWNPSIVGCKSEDTILLNAGGFEIITASGDWPQIEVEVAGQTIARPDILVK
jgi:Xaa-Pro aminopeptidase